MNAIIKDFNSELKPLLTAAASLTAGSLCVSIYMPIYTSVATSNFNVTRLKNLLRQTDELLSANRRNPAEAVKLLRPAFELFSDRQWQQDQGIAIFLAVDIFHYYALPLTFEELAVVGDRFHFQPLLPLLRNKKHSL